MGNEKERKVAKIRKNEREKIISTISKVLNTEESVIFAYLSGSFINEDFFEDIDVFIYVKDDYDIFRFKPYIRERLYEGLVKEGIEFLSIDELDVNIINDAPYDFVIDILRDGVLLKDKIPVLRTDYIEHISDEYRVNHFILDEAFK